MKKKKINYSDPNYKSDFDRYCEEHPNPITIEDIKKCPACGKKFKQIDNYSYKPSCKHFPKGVVLSIG